jgi:predicted dehydrogenase
MVKVGIVGIGFMGMIHYLAYQRLRGAEVTAICTRDPKKLAGDWRGIQGNFGPPGVQMELGPIGRYRRLDELLSNAKVDLVDICLPPAQHADAAIAALRAGKHVLCEKPIALTTRQAARMTAAAKQYRRLLMVAHVLPFFPEYAYALKLIQGGRYGRLLGGHFKRIISDPRWLPDFYDPRVIGGPVVDLHIHDAHFIRLIAGMPRAVCSTGRMHDQGGVVEFVTSHFVYQNHLPAITATSGVIAQQGRPFTHGFEIYLERATLFFDFAALADGSQSTPLTVLTADGKVERPRLGSGDPLDGFVMELNEACQAVRRGRPSTILEGALAHDALRLCERECRSVRQRRIVQL